MPRIILAEDDELIGEIIVECLSRAGFAVGWLRDGAAALQAIRFRTPHLVILDQQMPIMSGNQVLREMRSRPEMVMVPVMMLTAISGEGDQSIAYFDGADEYLTKPFDPSKLVFRAQALINKKLRRTMPDVMIR